MIKRHMKNELYAYPTVRFSTHSEQVERQLILKRCAMYVNTATHIMFMLNMFFQNARNDTCFAHQTVQYFGLNGRT